MILSLIGVVCGLGLLVWSAGWFVEGAALVARHFGLPPLLIGMVVVGFGTSAPELAVSALAALQGTPGLALGNAYGSNIANIALILGLTAMLRPIPVHSQVLRRELPVLAAVTALAAWQIHDGAVVRAEALVLLAVFAALMAWTIRVGLRTQADPLALEVERELSARTVPPGRAFLLLAVGLVVLVASSRLLVWGAVRIAAEFGVSDLVIGLTVVAVGTSLPELASTIIASRRGEHDLALGNVIGSNLFNTLAVVGIAGVIHPMTVGPEVFRRDIPVMGLLTVSLFVMGSGFGGPGRINRFEGALLLACFVVYTAYLLAGTTGR